MKIGDREIGPGYPVFIVAEAGFNHNGDLRTALEMVHAAKAAGADAFKVPAIDADCFTVPGLSEWKGEDQHAMFKRLQLSFFDIKVIAAECRQVGLVFFGTPDCEAHAEWLLDAGAPVLKVGSDDLTNTALISDLAALGMPLILSTGMSEQYEISAALHITQEGCEPGEYRPTVILHCMSLYPTPLEQAAFWRLRELVERYGHHAVGYSDHTDSVIAPAVAVGAGATIIEKHFTLDRALPGPDHHFSADPQRFGAMTQMVRSAEKMAAAWPTVMLGDDWHMRPVARRSIVAALSMHRGQALSVDSLAYKRPGTGLMPYESDKLIGKTLTRDVKKDEQIRLEDVA